MILPTLSRPQWESKLKKLGAEPLHGKGQLNTAEWWKAPGLGPFTVPVEADGGCDYWALQQICQALGDDTFPPLG